MFNWTRRVIVTDQSFTVRGTVVPKRRSDAIIIFIRKAWKRSQPQINEVNDFDGLN